MNPFITRGLFLPLVARMATVAVAACPGGVCPVPFAERPGGTFVFPPQPPIVSAPAAGGSSGEHPKAVLNARAAVVMITNRGCGEGSGVYLGDGYALTCDHLFRDQQGAATLGRILVAFPDGKGSTATLMARDPVWDLAIVRLESPPEEATAIRWSTAVPESGEALYACGFGRHGAARVVQGNVTGFGADRDRSSRTTDTILVSGAARPGDSGGPILNCRGELAGILWGTDGRVIVGTQVGRCWLFSRRWLQRQKPDSRQVECPEPMTPQQPEHPCAPRVDMPPPADDSRSMSRQMEQLRQDMALLRAEMARIGTIAGQPGPPGERGPAGPAGRDGAGGEIDIDALSEAVKKRISGSIRVRVEPVTR